MFEYDGWATLREDTREDDIGGLHRIVDELREVIEQFNDGSGVTDLRWINGTCMVYFAGCPNRRHDCVFGLFPWLAEHAPGSYGLLYVRDDEAPVHGNAFQVWRLRRRQVERHPDPFLSPCIPVIEDADAPACG